MAQNKKHHYVPRFYLKRFSPDGKSINIWNLSSSRKILSANLKNQCYRSYFYGKELDVEKSLGDLEGAAASLFRLIDEHGTPPPHGSFSHQLLVLSTLMQYGRTAYSADVLDEMNDKLMKHILAPRAKAKGIDLADFSIVFKEAGRFSLGMAMQTYPLLFDLDYKLLSNKTDVEFVTSDNPVVLYNQLFVFRKFGSNTGLAKKGLQIFYPISPRFTLLLFDPAVYSVGNKNNSIIDISLPRDIYEMNTLQACSAAENIYFQDHVLNVEALHRRAVPFRRTLKTRMEIFPDKETDDGSSELIASSREDVRTNLKLTFVHLTKNAKKWRDEFLKLKMQPAAVVRNQKLVNDHKEFMDKVKKKEYEPSGFFRFLANKYGYNVPDDFESADTNNRVHSDAPESGA